MKKISKIAAAIIAAITMLVGIVPVQPVQAAEKMNFDVKVSSAVVKPGDTITAELWLPEGGNIVSFAGNFTYDTKMFDMEGEGVQGPVCKEAELPIFLEDPGSISAVLTFDKPYNAGGLVYTVKLKVKENPEEGATGSLGFDFRGGESGTDIDNATKIPAGSSNVKVTDAEGNTLKNDKVTLDTDSFELPYKDVNPSDSWFYDAVVYNYKAGTMTGLNETTFGPYNTLARAHFAVILHRMNEAPSVEYVPTFKDVAAGQWYTNAILWASKNNIVTGYSDGSNNFGVGDKILREQMAVMMYRYAKFKEYDVSESKSIDAYKDAASVSKYATEAMEWAVASKIITGKDNGTKLDPQGNASRAECAIIIQRFMEKYN